MQFSFFVAGTPTPQGSIKSFYIKKINRVVSTSDNLNLKEWRQRIASEAQRAIPPGFYTNDRRQAYRLAAVFYFHKPPSKPKKIKYITTKPDCDKLLRACYDAMTGICYVDDSQIIGFIPNAITEKRYLESHPDVTHGPGIEITLEKLEA